MNNILRAACLLIAMIAFNGTASSDDLRSVNRTTRAGRQVEINWHFAVDGKCHPSPPLLTVTAAPVHGKVEIGTAVRKAREATVGMSVCTGQEVNGSLITYTPEPGFTGEDHFTYDEKLTAYLAHVTVTVRVR